MIRKKGNKFRPGSTRAKGGIAEQIVASMHLDPNVRVETNVFIPTKNRKGKPREIDILITSQVAGLPIRIAIECKNEKEITGVGKIDAFIGKLEHVGLSPQLSVYVSTSRYTIGAIERAKEVGMKIFLLKDVKDQINQIISQVFQSSIYLLATIATVQLSLSEDSPQPLNGPSLFFYDEKGKICGSIGDLVWDLWCNRKIPDRIGMHDIRLKIPNTWRQVYNDQELIFAEVTVKLWVTGHVITVSGEVKQHNLIDAIDQSVAKWQVNAKFPSPVGKHIVTEFRSEEELEKYFVDRKGFTLISGRLILPRIQWGGFYWPPSAKSLQKLQSLIDKAESDRKNFDWKPLPFDEIEGTDLSAAYEPIWQGHPYEVDRSRESTKQ